MINIQLYIEGQQIELFKDESITLTQSIQDIRDISKIFTDFTQTFNVPASKNNNKIFKHFHRFNIVGYDARKKKNAELYLNYKPFKNGKIKLEGVKLKNNEPHTYRLTFFGNIVNLKDHLGEDKISGLKHLNYFNFQYNSANIKEYMTNGLDVDFFTETLTDAIVFPLITTKSRLIFDSSLANTDKIKNINGLAGLSTNYGVPIGELKPAIRLYAIVKAIETHYDDIQFSDDFFSTDNTSFYGLYMWLHNKAGALFEDQEAQYPITNLAANITGDISEINGFKDASFVNTLFTIGRENRELRINVNPSGNSLYSVVIKKDGEEFKRFDNLTGTTTNSASGGNKVTNLAIENGSYTFFIETLTPSTYSIDISIIQKNNGFLTSKKQITTKSGVASFSVDKTVDISSIIPKMNVFEFLTGIFKMFNLTAFQDSKGIIQVLPLDDYFSSSTKVWDITKHLDKTQSTVDAILPFKEIEFKYKGTNSFLAKNFNETAGRPWGSEQYASSDKFDGKKYKIELPFEHFQYERLFTTNNGVLTESQSPVQYGYSVDETQEPYLGAPLIFYAIKPILSYVSALNLEATETVSLTSPYMPLNSNGTLNFFGIGLPNLNFHAEYDEYSGVPNDKTLFKTYYEKYVKDMFDVRKRITTAKAYLPMEMIFNLELKDKVILFDDIYRINKLTTNFETNQSTLELNNIFEELTFNTLTSIASIGITMDSILTLAGNTYINADSTALDGGFTIPDTETIIPNEIPINDPKPIFEDVPIVVTAPTIEETQILVSTSTEVHFNYKVSALGLVGILPQMEEYGFVYSTTQSHLTETNDIDVLKAATGVTTVPFVREQLSKYLLPASDIGYTKSGLTHPATVYWRFYARTNTGSNFDKADIISATENSKTVATVSNQYNNSNGDLLSGYTGQVGFGQFYYNTLLSNYGGPTGITGQVIFSPYNNWPLALVKKVVEWHTSHKNPVKGIWYDLDHTFKVLNSLSNDGFFSMGDVSSAQIQFNTDQFNYYRIFIKGGADITGSAIGGGYGNILANTGDLQSTS